MLRSGKPLLLLAVFQVNSLFAQVDRQPIAADSLITDAIRTQLNRHLEENSLVYRKLLMTRGLQRDVATIPLDLLRQRLREYGSTNQTALLYYRTASDTLFSYLLNGNNGLIAYYRQAFTAQLVAGLTNTLYAIRGVHIKGESSDSIQRAQQLKGYARQLLPKPIADSRLGVRYLLIVPEANLGTVPFYALRPFGDNAYLIDRMAVSVTPSLDVLTKTIYQFTRNLNQDRYARKPIKLVPKTEFDPLKPVFVGDVTYSQSCSPVLAPLPQTAREVAGVRQRLGGTLLLNTEATTANLSKYLAGADYIHLATHGSSSLTNALDRSFISLSSSGNDCGQWTARQIQQCKLSGEALVVLSACQTGLGQTHEGGIIGLARAFQLAGAANVVMSLWNVADKPTADLMIGFADALLVEQPFFPAENLRQAILTFRKSHPNPADWAAFMDFGVPYPTGVRMKMKKP